MYDALKDTYRRQSFTTHSFQAVSETHKKTMDVRCTICSQQPTPAALDSTTFETLSISRESAHCNMSRVARYEFEDKQ